jgi:NitT/TauT family transport system ATP-binding protein
MDSSRVSIEALSLRRRGLDLVADLWVDIDRGETLAVMGPSGAGKTTLLRAIAGLTDDFTGTISGVGTKVAVVFQDPRLLPWRTALQNVELVCASCGARRAREWLDAVGLADAADLFPSQMSGGMRQRVAVARALAFDAPVVVIDEPFASLDDATAAALRDDAIEHLSASACSVLWVTHDRAEAERVADRILFLSGPPTGAWRLA